MLQVCMLLHSTYFIYVKTRHANSLSKMNSCDTGQAIRVSLICSSSFHWRTHTLFQGSSVKLYPHERTPGKAVYKELQRSMFGDRAIVHLRKGFRQECTKWDSWCSGNLGPILLGIWDKVRKIYLQIEEWSRGELSLHICSLFFL